MSSPEFEQFERLADAAERQADALELIAGMLILSYCAEPSNPDYSTEEIQQKARFYAGGGRR